MSGKIPLDYLNDGVSYHRNNNSQNTHFRKKNFKRNMLKTNIIQKVSKCELQ